MSNLKPGDLAPTFLEAAGIAVRPGPSALVHAQDKIAMREALDRAGLPSPAWRHVASPDDLEDVGTALGWPLILKVSRGGYDGRGVWVVDDADERAALVTASASSLPDLMCGMAEGRLSNITSMLPEIRSISAGPERA